MKIPKQLPQFNEERALLVVVGSQSGILYLGAEGVIDVILTVQQPTPRYTDREGFFANAGRSLFSRSGSVYEENTMEQTRRFFKKVCGEVRSIVKSYRIDRIYIYEPLHTKGYLTTALKEACEREVVLVKYGNYIHASPTTLLEHYMHREERDFDPADPASVKGERNAEEKRKILAFAKQARAVIRGT